MRVGFIGLGRMGRPMAEHLLKAGHQVTVHNRSKMPEAELARLGAQVAPHPAAVAANSEFVFTCVTDPPAVTQIYTDPTGILAAEIDGCVLVDHSTIDPDLARHLADAAGQRGAQFLDAPVSGGVAGAHEGTLSIMVGGSDQGFVRAEPVMQAYGAKIVHMGPSGAGAATKLANQLLVGVHSAAAAEAIALAMREGLDLELVLDVIGSAFGASRMLERNGRLTLSRQFDGGTSIKLIAKDLRLIKTLASKEGMTLPMAAMAQDLFEGAQDDYGDKDLAAIILPLERAAGLHN